MLRKGMNFTLLLLISSIFVVMGSIGGCSDNNGGGVKPTPPPPTQPPPTQPPPGADLSAIPIDPAQAPVDCEDPIWDEAAEISVTTGTVVSGRLYGDGQLNMSGTFGGTTDFNSGDDANLRLAALYTTGGSEIYIRARWDDTIRNLDRRRALYNGPADPEKPDDPAGYTSQLNDDKIGFAFEITPGTSSEFGTFDEVGCAASCHFVAADESLDMRPETGKADIWHWKTSRSEPVGYVNDQFAEPVGGRQTDAGVSIESRNRADSSNRGGPMMIWDGTEQMIPFGPRTGETLDPAFILLDGHLLDVEAEGRDADNGEVLYVADCVVCHGPDGEGGIGPALDTKKFGRLSDAELDGLIAAGSHPGSGAYLALSGADQADLRLRTLAFWGTAGYYLKMPEGSAADITTMSELDYSEVGIDALVNIATSQAPDFNTRLNKYKFVQDEYCVVLARELDTTHDDDTQFDIAQEYVFGVALMDNDGQNHIGNTRLTLDFLLP
jgi:mono/diheme cytochrome c family protein